MRQISFVSWNIDGLAPALPAAASPQSLRARATAAASRKGLIEMNRALGAPDVMCLQEVRLRPADVALVAHMESALPGYGCGHALCRDARNVTFRGGRAYGVATYVRDDLAPRWLPPPQWDLEGRFVAFELPVFNLVVANVYAVNGTDKPYFDHARGEVVGDRHDFKLRFQQQLLELLQHWHNAGRQLVLLGDWNVSRTALDTHPRLRTAAPFARARAMLNDRFIPELELVDAFRALHPDVRKYTWFNRVAARYGRLDAARVDFALISRRLLPRVTHCDIAEELALSSGSDHAPVQLQLRFDGSQRARAVDDHFVRGV